MNKGHAGMLFLIFVVFGILISVQFRSIVQSETGDAISIKELTEELEKERNEKALLMEQLTSIEAKREQLLKNFGETLNNEEINSLLKKRDFEYLRAGLAPVKGSGIVITLEDAPAIGELNINDYIIHDSQVNAILDELKAYGAQAISVNGERVISTTKPVCAGPTIIVNNNRYPPPYVIKAIGDPYALFDAVNSMSTVAFMRLAGIRVDIVMQDEILIDRYHPIESLDAIFDDLEVVTSEDL
ncbi:MAG: DUF881 domain-containing protein [Clostridiaceae bacterium]|nr:DUF881 domain-containing protein [Clostridiaceae bacterium]